MLILISDAFDKSLKGKLEAFGEVTEDKSRVKDANVVLVRALTKCNKEWIDEAKNCKLIIRGGVGIDNIDKPYADSKGMMVYNTPKASGVAVAELAFAHMISVPNNLFLYHNGMLEKKWLKKTKRHELSGKTLALVGIGNIARNLASRAMAFGMKIVSYDKYVTQEMIDKMLPGVKMCQTIEECVKDADYISLHTPLTPETKGMINKALISKMEKHPVLINTCRADVINAEDVKEALDNGTLSWYCTDVYPSDKEDVLFSMDYPLFKSDKVTFTPHVGANSEENMLRIGDEVVDLIASLIKDKKLN